MLDDAVNAPALDAKDWEAARAPAIAYLRSNALGSFATDAKHRTALDDIVAKGAVIRQRCGMVAADP